MYSRDWLKSRLDFSLVCSFASRLKCSEEIHHLLVAGAVVCLSFHLAFDLASQVVTLEAHFRKGTHPSVDFHVNPLATRKYMGSCTRPPSGLWPTEMAVAGSPLGTGLGDNQERRSPPICLFHSYISKITNQPASCAPLQTHHHSLVLARPFVVWYGSIQETTYVQCIPCSLIYVLETVCTEESPAEISSDHDENVVDILGEDKNVNPETPNRD